MYAATTRVTFCCAMPCSDITEVLEAHLDHDDRLVGYSLRKRTCGAAIGDTGLLAELLAGRELTALLALTPADVVSFAGEAGDAEFLPAKHLAAVQAALAVYSGAARGAPKDPCVLESLEVSPDGVHLTAHVAIEAVVAAIRPCGSCGSCGSHKKGRLRVLPEG